MKKKLLGIRLAAGMCAALGWWGLLYPELALTPDTVSIQTQAQDGSLQKRQPEWTFDGEWYQTLLNAAPGSVKLRSRLLTDLSSFWEAIYHGNQ